MHGTVQQWRHARGKAMVALGSRVEGAASGESLPARWFREGKARSAAAAEDEP